ncbi:MAG: hypothetical protein FWE64_03965 [Alphaproteobacteria bacterium]|nr:hypothetical protein [Alphaproteobacteria bacterium]
MRKLLVLPIIALLVACESEEDRKERVAEYHRNRVYESSYESCRDYTKKRWWAIEIRFQVKYCECYARYMVRKMEETKRTGMTRGDSDIAFHESRIDAMDYCHKFLDGAPF